MKLAQLIIGLFFSFILTSCKQEAVTYDYLMQHPAELQSQYTRCSEEQNQDEAQCAIINQAARDFFQLVEERAKNPEGFGQEIMNLQMALAKDHEANSEEYQKQLQKLQTMYAVIAATSME